jgi:transcriptional regulator with XRE-family HTH domain
MLVVNFAERMIFARNQTKLSQKGLAERLGLSQGTISKIERGDTESSGFVVQIAMACGVNPTWLATGEGEPLIAPSEATDASRRTTVESGAENLADTYAHPDNQPEFQRRMARVRERTAELIADGYSEDQILAWLDQLAAMGKLLKK